MRDIHKAGGNYFNDMRIDYDAAFDNFIELNSISGGVKMK